MHNTYLIFFGKSQDFSFHAFDSKSYINDFNVVIKDFDELESKVFTVDDVSNSQLLSKYVFNKNGKTYSLLKLYSFAQAYGGSRIAGSIFGVALLSERDIKISENNLSILAAAKKNFAKESLNGVKFKTSDFLPEAEKIWRAIINHNGENLLEAVEYNNFNNLSVNNKVKAFLVKDISKNPTDLNDEIIQTSRLYFSDDLSHLKRTQVKWGAEIFPFYHLENGSYVLYKEKPVIPPLPPINDPLTNEEITRLKMEKGEIEREKEDLNNRFEKFRKQSKKKFLIAIISAAVLGLTILTFFFTSLFGIIEKDPKTNANGLSTQSIDNTRTQNPTQQQKIPVDLNHILVDSNKLAILATLLENIKQYPITQDKQKFYDAIVRDSRSLGIDLSLFNRLKPVEKVTVTPVKNATNSNISGTPDVQKQNQIEDEQRKKAEREKQKNENNLKKVNPQKTEIKKEETPEPETQKTKEK